MNFIEQKFNIYREFSLEYLESNSHSFYFQQDKIIPRNLQEIETMLEKLKTKKFNDFFVLSNYGSINKS